jgi:hypothetical protein
MLLTLQFRPLRRHRRETATQRQQQRASRSTTWTCVARSPQRMPQPQDSSVTQAIIP